MFWNHQFKIITHPKSLIQPLETLPIELTRTHPYFLNILRYNKNDLTSGCFANTQVLFMKLN